MNNSQETLKRPKWLKIKVPVNMEDKRVEDMLLDLNLNTVCKEARCPNKGECYSNGTATFMILGKNCTRGCKFCNVTSKTPTTLDLNEPKRVAKATKIMNLNYVVITSVTRDDLIDGGSSHFKKTTMEILKTQDNVIVELLIPDLGGNKDSINNVANSGARIIGHNIETVPRLYEAVRPEGNYRRSLEVLEDIKSSNNHVFTKSGIILGLGETFEEVLEVMRDLRRYKCDFITLGQYLRPSKEHYEVREYIPLETYERYKEAANKLGFKGVAAGPLVRSSYKAMELFKGAL